MKKYFYNESVDSFYHTGVHKVIPVDSIGVTDEEYLDLITKRSEGYQITVVNGIIELLPPKEKPTEERVKELTNSVQSYMNTSAKTYGYDSIASAVTYADEASVAKFQTEGQAFRAWRSLVWDKCYKILADWEAGTIPEPSPEEVIAQLPTLVI
jgi:hypothetical protein